MSVSVSVVVPTRNSGRTIERCLRSIRRQFEPVELIVVDNVSTDDTCEIAHRYADLVLVAGPERSAQRNVGLSRSKGQFVFFVDSDMYLEREVVRKCLEIWRTTHAAVAVPEKSFGEGFWANCKALERSVLDGNEQVAGARFYARDLLDAIGGYDEDLYAGEDWDISARAAAHAGLAFADARILHDEGPLKPLPLWKKKYYYGRGLAAYLRKSPRDSRRRLGLGRLAQCGAILTARAPLRVRIGALVQKGGEIAFGAIGILSARTSEIAGAVFVQPHVKGKAVTGRARRNI